MQWLLCSRYTFLPSHRTSSYQLRYTTNTSKFRFLSLSPTSGTVPADPRNGHMDLRTLARGGRGAFQRIRGIMEQELKTKQKMDNARGSTKPRA